MRIQILLVEDDARLHLPISQTLGYEYCVTIAESVAEARTKFGAKRFDTILLGSQLPDASGIDFCKELRSHSDVPIIFLTADTDRAEKLAGFAAGADDFICKPLDPEELTALVQARCRGRVSRFRGMRVDWTLLRVLIKEDENTEKDARLTPLEFRILAALIRAPRRTLSRQGLMNSVWGNEVHVGERGVDKHVCILRRKLGSCANYIRTLPAEGYRFSDEEF